MNSYMVVARFKDGVTPDDIRALIPAEQAQAKILEDAGSAPYSHQRLVR